MKQTRARKTSSAQTRQRALSVARAAALCAALSATGCATEQEVCESTQGAFARYSSDGTYRGCCWPEGNNDPALFCGCDIVTNLAGGCAVVGPFVPPAMA